MTNLCQGLWWCQLVSLGVNWCHFSDIYRFYHFSMTFPSLFKYFPQLIIRSRDCWSFLDASFVLRNVGYDKNIPRIYGENTKKWKILWESWESHGKLIREFSGNHQNHFRQLLVIKFSLQVMI